MTWAYIILGAIAALALYGLGYSLVSSWLFARKMQRLVKYRDWLKACHDEDCRALWAQMKRNANRNQKGDWHGR